MRSKKDASLNSTFRQPGRASATVSDVVQTKANPTNSTAAAGKRPDEGGHALSDELSKRADEGTLTKK
jgi:hypothetical protein